MEPNYDLSLFRAVKLILDVVFGGLVIASALLVLFALISPMLVRGFDLHLTASVPVSLGGEQNPTFQVDIADTAPLQIQAVTVDRAQGTLRIETQDPGLLRVGYANSLFTALGLAVIFYLLREVLKAVMQGEVFSPANSSRIRKVGYAVLIVGLLRPLVASAAAAAILNRLQLVEPPIHRPAPFDAGIILTSLLILVLAHIWSYGLELERDRALTI